MPTCLSRSRDNFLHSAYRLTDDETRTERSLSLFSTAVVCAMRSVVVVVVMTEACYACRVYVDVKDLSYNEVVVHATVITACVSVGIGTVLVVASLDNRLRYLRPWTRRNRTPNASSVSHTRI